VASLKVIRKRIASVQSTQKITRAMKMVAGARLNKAQQRITELRPYADKTHAVLSAITAKSKGADTAPSGALDSQPTPPEALRDHPPDATHPLLVERAPRRILLVVLTSDRGLCGAFNTNINKRAERDRRERIRAGQAVDLVVVGRKGRDYMARRDIPVLEYLPGIWDNLGLATAQRVGRAALAPFDRGDADAIYLVYNEFKSAMSQQVVVEPLLPVTATPAEVSAAGDQVRHIDFEFEPDERALLGRLAPMYVDVSMLRALYESQASELGARMTAMEAATKNAKEMLSSLTLQYNKARQAAITKELMEIIGGSEALKE
jgi:F-type H+-transporting ATPase subunit gamma